MTTMARLGLWVLFLGNLTLLAGLRLDARLHVLDPGLAAREEVFTMSNPGHALAGVGMALVVGATALLLLSTVRRRALLGTTAAVVGTLLLVLLSLSTVRLAVAQSGDDGHQHHHPPAPAGGPSPAPGTHAPPAATPEQRAAAERLVAEVRAAAARFATVAAAEAEGYRRSTAFLFGTWGPAHWHNRAYNTDGRWLDPRYPEGLVYLRLRDGRTVLLGVMFVAFQGQGPRPGGPLTEWHTHENLCIRPDGRVALAIAPGQCPPGSSFVGAAVEMMHVWLFDHPGGPFAHHLDAEGLRAALRQFGQ
jgi:hypothetical protein